MIDQTPTPNAGREVFHDFLFGIIGIDKGFLKTLVDHIKSPTTVVNGYLNRDNTYIPPFTMLAIAITLFYLVSGLLVNWDEVYKILMDGMLIFNSLILGKKEAEKMTSEFSPIYKTMLSVFSNFLAVYYALNIIFLSLILSWFTKKLNLAFYHHVVVIGYSSAYSILTWVLVILSGLIHFWVFLGVVVLLSFFNTNKMLNGYGDLKNEIKKPMIKSLTIYFSIAVVLGILIAMTALR